MNLIGLILYVFLLVAPSQAQKQSTKSSRPCEAHLSQFGLVPLEQIADKELQLFTNPERTLSISFTCQPLPENWQEYVEQSARFMKVKILGPNSFKYLIAVAEAQVTNLFIRTPEGLKTYSLVSKNKDIRALNALIKKIAEASRRHSGD